MKRLHAGILACIAVALVSDRAFTAEREVSPAPDSSLTAGDAATSAPLAKPTANHKLFGELAGTWNYILKISLTRGKPPVETSGVVVRTPILGGRYYMADFNVELLPGADGKLQKAGFRGKSIEGYDNAKERFVSVWIDNASTGITSFEGTYDPSSHTFNYTSETEPERGKKTKVREQIHVTDTNHYHLDWYEEHAGREVKTIEIDYTRASEEE